MTFCVVLVVQPVPRDSSIEHLSLSYCSLTPYSLVEFFGILIQWYMSSFKPFSYCTGQDVFEIILCIQLFHFFVVLLLFLFSISFLSLLGIRACDLLSLIAHKDNSYHVLTISISVELLLLIVNYYRSSLIRLLCQFSLVPSSNIYMLLN